VPRSGDSHGGKRPLRLALHQRTCGPRDSAEERFTVQLDCGLISRTNNAPRRGSRVKLLILAASVVAMLIAPSAAFADATLSSGLADAAAASPNTVFRVIVQGQDGRRSNQVGLDVQNEVNGDSGDESDGNGRHLGVTRQFVSINGVAADLTGREILRLATRQNILAISVDQPVRISSGPQYSNKQRWPYVSGAAKFWSQLYSGIPASMANPPTIAVVDSGVDPDGPDLAGRVLREVNLTSLPNNSPHDGRGHGTFVASIAAGSGASYAGVAPNAKLVSIDVVDDTGVGMSSDVIAAADWILANKAEYNIRVANFSLHGSQPSTFRFDPLNRAVEKLWFSGVVVVAAAGNYGATQSGVLYSPGNDPFVITVGAVDADGSVGTHDDFAAPWSAYGYTLDGFAKPEISAPGRYMVGAVPSTATLTQERPDRVVEPGYMLMSGTSFAAPVVAGTAAYILARHPSFTPDQVKGALMLTASPTPDALPMSTGVGEIAAEKAVEVTNPPNPNLALNQFVHTNLLTGDKVFDQATWTTNASLNPMWDAATWTTATWTTATWTTATWATATWTTATWVSATWTTATWTTATWTTATWTTSSDATWTTSAESEANTTSGEYYDPLEKAVAEADLGITPVP
jgi:serine protease AprX